MKITKTLLRPITTSIEKSIRGKCNDHIYGYIHFKEDHAELAIFGVRSPDLEIRKDDHPIALVLSVPIVSKWLNSRVMSITTFFEVYKNLGAGTYLTEYSGSLYLLGNNVYPPKKTLIKMEDPNYESVIHDAVMAVDYDYRFFRTFFEMTAQKRTICSRSVSLELTRRHWKHIHQNKGDASSIPQATRSAYISGNDINAYTEGRITTIERVCSPTVKPTHPIILPSPIIEIFAEIGGGEENTLYTVTSFHDGNNEIVQVQGANGVQIIAGVMIDVPVEFQQIHRAHAEREIREISTSMIRMLYDTDIKLGLLDLRYIYYKITPSGIVSKDLARGTESKRELPIHSMEEAPVLNAYALMRAIHQGKPWRVTYTLDCRRGSWKIENMIDFKRVYTTILGANEIVFNSSNSP